MSLALRLLPEPIRSVAFGSVSGTYTGIGTAITNPARVLYLVSTLDIHTMISFNGIDDHMVLLANGYIMLDVSSNQSFNQGLYVSMGQRLYVKQIGGAAATSGNVYLTVMYGANG